MHWLLFRVLWFIGLCLSCFLYRLRFAIKDFVVGDDKYVSIRSNSLRVSCVCSESNTDVLQRAGSVITSDNALVTPITADNCTPPRHNFSDSRWGPPMESMNSSLQTDVWRHAVLPWQQTWRTCTRLDSFHDNHTQNSCLLGTFPRTALSTKTNVAPPPHTTELRCCVYY